MSWQHIPVICLILLLNGHAGISQSKPNIIYILVDDLGYGDLNLDLEGIEAFDNPNIKTPYLADFAQQSLVFTHHYAASPVCSPSRAGLLTGRTPTRSNINRWIVDRNYEAGEYLRDEEITLAEKCLEAGYQTAIFGKWHLNAANWLEKSNWEKEKGTFPNQQGFQFGMVSKENPHLTIHLHSNSQKNPGDFFSIYGDTMGTIKGYTSRIVADSALSWLVQRDKQKPFFLYLPFDAPHERIYNPDEYDAMYDTGDPNMDVYYANVTYLDAQIGRLIEGIDALGLEENTIIFFSSDNGPEVTREYYGSWRSYGTSYPLHGQKRTLWEGGVRVPGMIRWLGKIDPGVSSEPNSTLDVMPTLCELIGVEPPSDRELDGTSLMKLLLKGKSINRSKPLYWQYEFPQNWVVTGTGYRRRFDGEKSQQNVPMPSVSIRSGNYVLRGIYEKQFQKPNRYVLFDVVNDVGEENELSGSMQKLRNQMIVQLEEMYESVNEERKANRVLTKSK